MIRAVFIKTTALIKEFFVRLFFLALLLATLTLGFSKFWQWQKHNLLATAEKKVESALEETREKASQSGDLNLGVAFTDQEYTVFKTASDWEGRLVQEDETHKLTKTLHFANHNLAQDCGGFQQSCVIFKAGSGEVLRVNEKQEFTIVIYDDETNEERLISILNSNSN